MASRESSTRRPPPGTLYNPNSSNPASRSNSTSTRRHNSTRSTATANRNPSPPKSKPSSPSPATSNGPSRDNSRSVRPSNSTRQQTRTGTPNTQQQQNDRERRPVQTSTQKSPEYRPSARDGAGTGTGSTSRNPDTSAKPLPRVRLTDPPSGSRGLERKDTAASGRRETELKRSGSLSRNDSGNSSRSAGRDRDRDLTRSGSTRRRDPQTSATNTQSQRQGSPPKAYTPPKPLANPYYKPFTPFKPLDQHQLRVKYTDGYQRPVNEHGQFLDRDAEKLVPMTTGSTAGWVMVPDNGSIMVCSSCKEPVNPFRPKKSHKNCR